MKLAEPANRLLNIDEQLQIFQVVSPYLLSSFIAAFSYGFLCNVLLRTTYCSAVYDVCIAYVTLLEDSVVIGNRHGELHTITQQSSVLPGRLCVSIPPKPTRPSPYSFV